MKRVLAAAAAVIILAANPAGGSPKTLTFSGQNCTEAAAFFLLDPAIVRPYVPERFTIGLVNDTPPLAELVVATTSCDEVAVGKAAGATFFSEVGIYIENVDDSPGHWHYYGLWQASTHKQLSRSLSRLGMTAPLVERATFTSVTGRADVSATVPWKRAPYSVQLLNPAPISLFGLRPSVWWYSAGKDRYVRVIYAIESEALTTSGTGTIESSADSPLGEMLGTARLADATMIERYATVTGIVERVKL
ncbi:MAG: hypothetical protein M3N53_03395 [Actinomycetota bacterium]|nr:hypothetical protein [Actinomycetota bacterium]